MPSSGKWRYVELVWTDVLEERIASISRVQKSASEEPAWGGCSHIPQDDILHSHRCENLKILQFVYCCLCILCGGSVFTEPLPSNERGKHSGTQTDGIGLRNKQLRAFLKYPVKTIPNFMANEEYATSRKFVRLLCNISVRTDGQLHD
jgi:hypothetical protein